ncbi:iron ABC transporter permease [Paraburkholderia tropica]|uniref:ABC transporter permease n=1 Tax=Paraburkholderia tropica TaxID=92647 RepID=UPI003015D7B8
MTVTRPKVPILIVRALVLLVLLTLVVWPLAMLLLGSFRSAPPGYGGVWTTQAPGSTLSAPGVAAALRHSVTLACLATVLSVPLAAFFAFVSERTDAPLRRLITPTMALMFAMPSLFYAIGYSLLGNQYTGLFNRSWQWLSDSTAAPVNIESWYGVVIVTVFRTTAFLYLYLLGPVRSTNRTLEDASRTCGVAPFMTVVRVTLPSLIPALGSALLLSLVGGLEAFDVVLILGAPAHIGVVATRIFEFIQGSMPPDYMRASFLSSILALVVAGLTLAQLASYDSRRFVTVGGKPHRNRRLRLGHARWPVGAWIAVWLLAAQVLPIAALVYSSVQPAPGVFGTLTLSHYFALFERDDVRNALATTILLGLVVGGCSMALGLVCVLTERRAPPWLGRALRLIAMAPLAMPGIVTPLAITWAYVSIPGLRALYGTVWLMAVSLMATIMPLSTQLARAAEQQLSSELYEAALTAGASPLRASIDITLRLIGRTFLAGWYIAAIVVAGNLDVPLLLGSPDLNTVAGKVYELNQLGQTSISAALLITLIALIGAGGATVYGVGLLLSYLRTRRHHGRAAVLAQDIAPLNWSGRVS